MGKGLGFQKKIGDPISDDKIEKVYAITTEWNESKLAELLTAIPLEQIQVANEIVSFAKVSLGKALSENLFLTLSDHIHFALERFEKGMEIKNALLWEIKRFYNHEFLIGKEALHLIHERLGVKLPEDEAGFIALHFVNAAYNRNTTESITSTKIIKEILQIIRLNYQLEFNEDDLNYDRLLTHLKYFTKRIITNSKDESTSDEIIAKIIENSYPEAYKCALKIKEYIENTYNYEVNEDEIIYLTMHIHRVVLAAREN